MPQAGFPEKKEEIVLTPPKPTAYSGSVRNITYIVSRSYPAFAIRRFLEVLLLAALGAIITAAAFQGCSPKPAKPERPIWRDSDTPVHTQAAFAGRGTPTNPNGHKALNSVTDQGELPCKYL
jgi:hypothetical protein